MLVILDFDGTIADTWPWLAEELVEGAATLNYRAIRRSQAETLRGLPTGDVFRALDIPLWRLPAFARHLRQRAQAAAGMLPLFEGAVALIRTLDAAGIRIAIVSSNSVSVVRTVLGEELSDMISHYECGASIFGKAAKFKRLMRAAGSGAHETIAVGDETRDVDAADAAGIAAIACEWGYAAPGLLRTYAPGRTAKSLPELTTLLLSIHRNMPIAVAGHQSS